MSVAFAQKGLKVLHVGCDPKHDSTIHIAEKPVTTVLEMEDYKEIVTKGKENIDCIECGGPPPGVGCAGRGILKMFEVLEKEIDTEMYDVILFDVLGDVVCGGFAAPLRSGFADKVVIVTSEEIASLYAANNIIKAIQMYAENGAYLAGIIHNVKDNTIPEKQVTDFSKKAGTSILAKIPRDSLIHEAEQVKKTILHYDPDSKTSKMFIRLAATLLDIQKDDSKKIKSLEGYFW